MSVLSQFIGGDATEVGQVIPTTGAMNYFISGSKEYLRTGFLRAYDAKYSTLRARSPYACWTDLSVTNAYPAFYANTVGGNCKFWHDGTRYWFIRTNSSAEGNTAMHSTDLSTWTSGLSGSNVILDSIRVGSGTNIVAVGGNGSGTNIWSTQGTSGFSTVATPWSTQLSSVASNTAGNLIVALQSSGNTNAADTILTSTTGNSWTSRTGTGGTAFVMRAITWSPCANAFFIIGGSDTSISMNRTTDGFTQTAVWNADTTAGGIDNTFGSASKMFVAHSPTATIISQTGGKLRRTTDGTNWTVIDLNTVNGAALLSQPSNPTAYKIFYDSVTSRFICFMDSTSRDSSGVYTLHSTDNGVTWTPYFAYRLVGEAKPYMISSANNQTLVLNRNPGNTLCNVSNATNDIAQTDPDWVGATSVLFGSGGSVTTHMRIL